MLEVLILRVSIPMDTVIILGKFAFYKELIGIENLVFGPVCVHLETAEDRA